APPHGYRHFEGLNPKSVRCQLQLSIQPRASECSGPASGHCRVSSLEGSCAPPSSRLSEKAYLTRTPIEISTARNRTSRSLASPRRIGHTTYEQYAAGAV